MPNISLKPVGTSTTSLDDPISSEAGDGDDDVLNVDTVDSDSEDDDGKNS